MQRCKMLELRLLRSLGSALVGAFFCKEIRLRASVLKAGAMAGITAVLAIGTGLASGGAGVFL